MSKTAIQSVSHEAIIEEIIYEKNPKFGIRKIRISINDVGEAFITKRKIPEGRDLEKGSRLVVNISWHKQTERWLVEYIISINGELLNLTSRAKKKTETKKKIPTKKKRSMLKSTKETLTSIPFSMSYSDEEILEITNIIERENEVMVTWFREKVSAKPGNVEFNKREFEEKIIESFSSFSVTIMQWPGVYRSNTDNYRSSHPFIAHLCRGSAIIHKNKIDISEMKYKNTLFSSVHDYVMEDSKNRWVIVGDETGSLGEFQGRPDKSIMCWIAIPPNTNLLALPHDFHCVGNWSNVIKSYVSALENLQKEEEILMFTFEFEEGTTTRDSTKIGSLPNLSFWQDTLPLVLEKISESCDAKVEVDIFVEQVKELESGIGIIEPILNLKKWENFKFSQLWVTSKGEHPWLGYADALGHVLVNRKNEHLNKNQLLIQESIFERIMKSPYRQSSLKKVVNPLIAVSNSPLQLLRNLHSLESNDTQDYVRPFLRDSIQKCINLLLPNEWDDLLEHIDINSRDKKGQRATSIIHDSINIEKILKKLEGYDNLKFDLLRMMLGTSNHRGAMAEGIKCAKLCNSMLIDGFSPTPDKLQKFRNLLPGLNDNMFRFNENILDIPDYNESMTGPQIHRLGTIAQSLALTGLPAKLNKAIEIEELIRNHGDDRRHRARHDILLSELLIQTNEINRVNELLLSMEYDNQNSFYFATFLKFAVTNDHFDLGPTFADDMMKLLDDDHPSQRIAYWYARWALLNNKESDEITKKCVIHLLSLTDVPLFSHDAPGVILACELMDLESRGYELNFDTTEFYEMVKSNSQPSTLRWLEEHPPNEDDWLAPLNFNYR